MVGCTSKISQGTEFEHLFVDDYAPHTHANRVFVAVQASGRHQQSSKSNASEDNTSHSRTHSNKDPPQSPTAASRSSVGASRAYRKWAQKQQEFLQRREKQDKSHAQAAPTNNKKTVPNWPTEAPFRSQANHHSASPSHVLPTRSVSCPDISTDGFTQRDASSKPDLHKLSRAQTERGKDTEIPTSKPVQHARKHPAKDDESSSEDLFSAKAATIIDQWGHPSSPAPHAEPQPTASFDPKNYVLNFDVLEAAIRATDSNGSSWRDRMSESDDSDDTSSEHVDEHNDQTHPTHSDRTQGQATAGGSDIPWKYKPPDLRADSHPHQAASDHRTPRQPHWTERPSSEDSSGGVESSSSEEEDAELVEFLGIVPDDGSTKLQPFVCALCHEEIHWHDIQNHALQHDDSFDQEQTKEHKQ